MCGIVGYTGHKQAVPLVLLGLERLEYRGYDSAGIACLESGKIRVTKTVGKVAQLKDRLHEAGAFDCHCAMGHTRWATHGGVTEVNAHPHMDAAGKVAIIHNGIVENYVALKAQLKESGVECVSDTDTEVVAQTLGRLYAGDPLKALGELFGRLEGAFALVIMFADRPGEIYCARKGAPLVVALGDGETLCASDVPALAEYADKVVFLEEGELCRLTPSGAEFWNLEGEPHSRTPQALDVSPSMIDKAGYAHFMLKEIYEQSAVVRNVLEGRLTPEGLVLDGLLSLTPEQAKELRALQFVACGSSCYAATVAQRILEWYLSVPMTVDVASEYRSRPDRTNTKTLAVFVSQSGETSDTLAALKVAKSRGHYAVAVTNQVNSSIAREAADVIDLRAGIEVGVAATKTFTSQVITLVLMGFALARLRGDLSQDDLKCFVVELSRLPWKMDQTLARCGDISSVAERFSFARDFLFLGRGVSFPVAMEGALKLKEISYVHAEAFAAGEMKHGPIALLDETVPSVVVAPGDELLAKTLSNMQECIARKSPVILVTTDGASVDGRPVQPDAADVVIFVPEVSADFSPLLTLLPLQLFAYHSALIRGRNIDQPRNLAKSVTVE